LRLKTEKINNSIIFYNRTRTERERKILNS
jgi:hypothetical protein